MDYCMKTPKLKLDPDAPPKLKFDPDAPQVYADRIKIPHPPGGELVQQLKKLPDGWPIPCRFFSAAFMVSLPCSDESHEACRTGIL